MAIPVLAVRLRGVAQTVSQLQPGQYEDVSITDSGPLLGDVWVMADDSFVQTGGYEFTSFDVPAATNGADAAGINSAGQVVGQANFPSPIGPISYLMSDGVFSTFAVPGAARTSAEGINDRGQIVGIWLDVSGGYHGFLTTTDSLGTTTTFDLPGTTGVTVPYDINNAGEIVGEHNTGAGGSIRNGFLLSVDGSYTTIDFPGAPFTGRMETTTWARSSANGRLLTMAQYLRPTHGFGTPAANSLASTFRCRQAPLRRTSTMPARLSEIT